MVEEMSTAIFNLNDLISANQTLVGIEQKNKQILETFDQTAYSNALHSWASESFPQAFMIYSYSLSLPLDQTGGYLCSDGQRRDIWAYIPFCLGYTIQTLLQNLQTNFQGITITYSIDIRNPVPLFNIHATKV
jgi:hypothetical protein